MTGARWDYVFVSSNVPVPALLEKVRCAVEAGRRVVVAYFVRPWKPLESESITGATVIPRRVSFRAVEWRRVSDLGATIRWLRREVFAGVAEGSDVYIDSLDLLLMAQVAGRGRHCRFRFEMRDLHALQLGRGPASRVLAAVERRLLRRVQTLVLTSDAHYEAYYRRLYACPPVIVENVPAREAWTGFTRVAHDSFVVGFVGVLRYRRCLELLVDAARILRAKNVPIRVRFAGGGDEVDSLRAYASGDSFVEFHGPFRYNQAAQRLFADLDVIYSIYDADHANVRLAISTKFYEAQITKIPVLVAEGTYVAQRVRAARCGAAVSHTDAHELAERLEDAYRGRGWYREAQDALAAVDLERLFATHEASIRAAVLDGGTAAAP